MSDKIQIKVNTTLYPVPVVLILLFGQLLLELPKPFLLQKLLQLDLGLIQLFQESGLRFLNQQVVQL